MVMSDVRDILKRVSDVIEQRGVMRDKPEGERSMRIAVRTFNAMSDNALTEEEGWKFMLCLKLSRMREGSFIEDDYLDLVGYAALIAECAFRTQSEMEPD